MLLGLDLALFLRLKLAFERGPELVINLGNPLLVPHGKLITKLTNVFLVSILTNPDTCGEEDP